MVVFDSDRQKLFELKSQEDFDLGVISHMLDNVNKQQFASKSYTNDDFDDFLLEKPDVSSEQASDSNDDSNND